MLLMRLFPNSVCCPGWAGLLCLLDNLQHALPQRLHSERLCDAHDRRIVGVGVWDEMADWPEGYVEVERPGSEDRCGYCGARGPEGSLDDHDCITEGAEA